MIGLEPRVVQLIMRDYTVKNGSLLRITQLFVIIGTC